MDPETRWQIALSIRQRARRGRTDVEVMNSLAELLDCGRTAEGLALAERLAKIKRGKRMAKKNKIEDGHAEAERANRAGIRAAREAQIPRTPQEVQSPDEIGNRGSGVFKNPSRPGSGPGEFDASRYGVKSSDG